MKLKLKLLGAAFLTLAASPAWAIDDGPRAYFPLPTGTTNFNLMGIFLDTNSSIDSSTAIPGFEGHLDIGVAQFTHLLNVAGRSAAVFAVVPFGEVRGKAVVPGPLGKPQTVSSSSSGLGDVSFGTVIGLVNSPALTREQFAKQPTGFSAGGMFWVTAPTGEYSGDKLLNLGTNRWAFRVGAPLGWTFGGSYLSPKLTTIELTPSIIFYTDNESPFRADKRSQDALFQMEGHVTHNFNRALWGSFDLLTGTGGETRTDGVNDGNDKTWLTLGASLGVNFSRSLGITATYGGTVARNDSAPDGHGFRVNGRLTF